MFLFDPIGKELNYSAGGQSVPSRLLVRAAAIAVMASLGGLPADDLAGTRCISAGYLPLSHNYLVPNPNYVPAAIGFKSKYIILVRYSNITI